MRFGHTVKHNGVLYPAGTEIPEPDKVEDNVNKEEPEIITADSTEEGKSEVVTTDSTVEKESVAEQPPKRGRKPKSAE